MSKGNVFYSTIEGLVMITRKRTAKAGAAICLMIALVMTISFSGCGGSHESDSVPIMPA